MGALNKGRTFFSQLCSSAWCRAITLLAILLIPLFCLLVSSGLGSAIWEVGLLATVSGWLLGFVTSVLKEPVEQFLFGPELLLTPDRLKTVPREGRPEYLFLRVRVKNTKQRIAKRCRAYLVNIEQWDASKGEFASFACLPSPPLIWSYDAETDAVDIPYNVSRSVDVLYYSPGNDRFDLTFRRDSGGKIQPVECDEACCRLGL